MLPKKVLTYGERRKRADVQLILRDMEELESAFLSKTQKLRSKRQTQLMKRVEKVLPELEKAYDSNDKEEIKGIVKSIEMPSQKEWYKNIHSLINSSAKNGVLRAHMELLRLKELYEFADEWDVNVIEGATSYNVIFPKDAEEWLKKYAYEIGVITDETVITRIRETMQEALQEGTRGRDVIKTIEAISATWIAGEFHARTIARTETAKMYNAGRIAKWLDPENAGFVEALQYDAITDLRTTDLCKRLDGRIVSINNAKAIAELTPPNHFMCRATWIPVSKYEEWEDNWDDNEEAQKGFTAEVQLPKLIKRRKKGVKPAPLVQPIATVDPYITKDPDLIRSMTDADFKIAIKNITDQKLKLAMIKERAEKMLINNNGLKVEQDSKFNFTGIFKHTGKQFHSKFEVNGQEFVFFDSGRMSYAELNYALMDATSVAEVDDLLQAFRKENGKDLQYADLIVQLSKAFKEVPMKMTWNGLNKVKKSAPAKKLLTVKEPPLTANYKSATGLRQAVIDAQSWIDKYVPERLAPKSGVKLRFKNDLSRAYAQGGVGEIHFGRYENDAGVVVHETAHVIHWNNKDIADLVHEFYTQRTANEPMGKYHGENTKKDGFYNPYVGRDYGWEKRMSSAYSNTGFHGQEVLSMGMQAMYTDPEKFYREDKDHFLFIHAIMEELF